MFLKSLEKYSIFDEFYIFFREMPLRIYKGINAIQMLIIFIIKPQNYINILLNVLCRKHLAQTRNAF